MRKFALPLLLLLVLTSCRISEKPKWDTEWTAPILHSEVRFLDAIKDQDLIQVEGDNSVSLVLRDTIADFKLSEFVTIPDTSLQATVNLDSIRLTSDTITERVTLGEAVAGTQYEALINLVNGGPLLADIPPFEFTNMAPYNIDASQYFDWAILASGDLVVEITNHLPMDINRARFHIENASDQSVVATVIMTDIKRFETKSETVPLGGQYMESALLGIVDTLALDTTFAGTWIDKDTQYAEIKVLLKDLVADSAKAVFPEQNVIDEHSRISWKFDDVGVELTRIRVKSGSLDVTAFSNIGNPMFFQYELPTVRKDGQMVQVNTTLAAGSDANPSQYDTSIDLAGYDFDLTINGDSVNMFPQHFVGNLIYTGQSVIMSQQSHIDIEYALKDIVPSYVEGYIGQQQFSFSDTLALDFFNEFLSGSLDMVKPKADLVFENSVGADGKLTVSKLRGKNTKRSTSLDMMGSVFSDPFTVVGPRLPNVGATAYSVFSLNHQNSNIRDFVALMPDQIEVEMSVDANYNGIPALHNNFATDESSILAFLDLELPLHGLADQLTIKKDMPFSLETGELPEAANSARFRLIAENYFPFDTKIQMIFKNAANVPVDSLFANGAKTIPAGQGDLGMPVTVPGKATLFTTVDQARMDLLKTAKTAEVRISVSTKPAATAVRLYADALIRFNLVGDFDYGF